MRSTHTSELFVATSGAQAPSDLYYFVPVIKQTLKTWQATPRLFCPYQHICTWNALYRMSLYAKDVQEETIISSSPWTASQRWFVLRCFTMCSFGFWRTSHRADKIFLNGWKSHAPSILFIHLCNLLIFRCNRTDSPSTNQPDLQYCWPERVQWTLCRATNVRLTAILQWRNSVT